MKLSDDTAIYITDSENKHHEYVEKITLTPTTLSFWVNNRRNDIYRRDRPFTTRSEIVINKSTIVSIDYVYDLDDKLDFIKLSILNKEDIYIYQPKIELGMYDVSVLVGDSKTTWGKLKQILSGWFELTEELGFNASIIDINYKFTDIILASQNEDKIKEFRRLFREYGYNVISLRDLDWGTDIEETGITYEENALIKAKAVVEKYPDSIVVADDSGIEISALDNAPGVYSARYYQIINGKPPKNKDLDNIHCVLEQMREAKTLDLSAKQVCCLVMIVPELNNPICVQGEWDGCITGDPRGIHGFGYDSIFIPNGIPSSEFTNKTASEIGKWIDNHRSDAVAKITSAMKDLFLVC